MDDMPVSMSFEQRCKSCGHCLRLYMFGVCAVSVFVSVVCVLWCCFSASSSHVLVVCMLADGPLHFHHQYHPKYLLRVSHQ